MTKIARREQASLMESLSDRWGIETNQLIPVTKATIFKADAAKVSDPELIAFLMVCSRYDLNPFLRQIHAYYDRRGAVVPIVGVDGWVDLVGREKRYKGMRFNEIVDDKSGQVLGSTCVLKVEGLEWPVEVTEWMTECYRPTEPWKQMPRRMIRHKSLIQAARYAFGFSGIYDEDEARDIVEGTPVAIAEPQSVLEASQADQEQEQHQGSDLHPDETAAPQEAQDEPREDDRVVPESEIPATDVVKNQVRQVVGKFGLGPFATNDLSALEGRLILSKRTKDTLKPVLENIEKGRAGMF